MQTRFNFMPTLTFFALAITPLHFAHSSDSDPLEMRMSPEDVFAPSGFDDNDNAQLIIAGRFPSTCYKVGQTKVDVDPVKHEIRIQNFAYYYSGAPCLTMIVPWQKTLDLGVLPLGVYQVFVQQKDGQFTEVSTLSIAKAKGQGADDFLYANVQDALLKRAGPGQKPSLTLIGSFSVDCLYVREVRIVEKAPQVIEILPIADFIPGHACRNFFIPLPFETQVELRAGLKGNVLIHIRAMNGQSVNKVIPF